MLKSEPNFSYNYENSYEKFIRNHLQHYGYYKGNKLILRDLEGYENTYDYLQSDTSISESENHNKYNSKIVPSTRLRTTQITYDQFEDGQYIRKLKAPHNYVLNLQQPPRWPIEMQVLPEMVQHINVYPSVRESIYIANGSEIKPQPKGEESGRLIFEYNTYSGPFFTKSKCISKEVNDLRTISVQGKSDSDETLFFESRFESGNLERVYQISSFSYELFLRPDMYTSKHTQWYYFRVSNTRANKMYRFTICNFYKDYSLYNEGLKPLFYSEKDAQQSEKGWRRWGLNIAYYKNNLKYSTKKGDYNYYSLTWTCYFPHDNDTVYFSHCYPYTYSNLMKYIDNVSKDPVKNKICRIKLLTRTLAENISVLLTVTNSFSEEEQNNQKKIIVITGRVHPGESNASWMIEGVLDFLLSNNPDAMLLRDMFIFKIVPMLNPDGVIVGNYRCSLTGRDLNRNYKSQLKEFYPVIHNLRSLIDKLIKEREILFYCDFHGHSRKKNIFIYGCNDQKDENEFLLERAFPFLLSKNAPEKFDYRSCKFKMPKSKFGTSRIVFRHIGIPHSLTLEASFCGSNLSTANTGDAQSEFYHFNTNDLKLMGEAFCHSLLDFCDPDQTQVNMITAKIKDEIKRKLTKKLQSRGIIVNVDKLSILNLMEYNTDEDSSCDDNGSDSSDSNGLPSHFEYMENLKGKKRVKRRENKNQKDLKSDGLENKPAIGNRCATCLQLSNNAANQTLNNRNQTKLQSSYEKIKRKYKTPSPKIENNDEKEKSIILPRCFDNNSHKKISPNLPDETLRTTFQEIVASKIQLFYTGVSKYKVEHCSDFLCSFHKSELIKENEKKLNQNSNCQLWKHPGNISDQIYTQKPYKLKNLNRPKSGLPTNTFQIVSLGNSPSNDYKQKPGNHKILSPIKRNEATSKKICTISEESKPVNKIISCNK